MNAPASPRRAPSQRNWNANVVLPMPLAPATSTVLPRGNPPPRMSSNRPTPVVHLPSPTTNHRSESPEPKGVPSASVNPAAVSTSAAAGPSVHADRGRGLVQGHGPGTRQMHGDDRAGGAGGCRVEVGR